MTDRNLNSPTEVARSILVARGLPVMLDADLASLYSTPYVFTEHGSTMLAMILQSPRAIDMSVHVVRAFAALRDAARTNAALQEQLAQLEQRVGKHDADIADILAALRQLVTPPQHPKRGIGFLAEIK